MLRRKHGWGGNYIWGKAHPWSRNPWDHDAVKGIAFGVTAHGLSLVNGAAFVILSGPTLASYVGVEGTSTPWRMNVYDKAGVLSYGFVGEAGGGVTFGAELYTNPAFGADANWTKGTSWAIGAGVATATAATSTLTEDAVDPTAGHLLRHQVTITARTAGSIHFICDNAALTSYVMTVAATYTGYRTSQSTAVYGFGAAGASLSIDNASLKQMTECAATGVHIVSTKDGSTKNWTSIGAGFNYNDSGYRVELRRA